MNEYTLGQFQLHKGISFFKELQINKYTHFHSQVPIYSFLQVTM